MLNGAVNEEKVANGGFDGYIALIPTQENSSH
jgi:hypothetical protein